MVVRHDHLRIMLNCNVLGPYCEPIDLANTKSDQHFSDME